MSGLTHLSGKRGRGRGRSSGPTQPVRRVSCFNQTELLGTVFRNIVVGLSKWSVEYEQHLVNISHEKIPIQDSPHSPLCQTRSQLLSVPGLGVSPSPRVAVPVTPTWGPTRDNTDNGHHQHGENPSLNEFRVIHVWDCSWRSELYY